MVLLLEFRNFFLFLASFKVFARGESLGGDVLRFFFICFELDEAKEALLL